MFILFASLILMCSEPEPAYFEITVEGSTAYSLFINGTPIEANTKYKTEPLTEPICAEVEIRFVAGEELVKKTFFIDLKPGYKRHLTISISAKKPSYVWC